MALETSVILRSVLIKKSKTAEDAYESVKALCTKDDIDSVEAYFKHEEEENKKK